MANTVIPIPTLVQGKSSLYNHSDPLIRRLRLEDPYGRPIDNLKEVFQGKEVAIFYVGSMHGNGKRLSNHNQITAALRSRPFFTPS
jgi:hypothetical protein